MSLRFARRNCLKIKFYFFYLTWQPAFVVWGFLNGVWLVLEHWTEKRRLAFFSRLGFDVNGRVFNFFGWLLVIHVGAFFGVFFRTDSPEKAFNFLGNVLNSNTNLLGVRETKKKSKTWSKLPNRKTFKFIFSFLRTWKRIMKPIRFQRFIKKFPKNTKFERRISTNRFIRRKLLTVIFTLIKRERRFSQKK